MIALQIAGGLCLLILGGETLVRGAVSLAERLKLSSLLIGLTVVAMGGSMPELVTTVEAALLGSPGIAIGNIIGSNIANSLLILGTAAVLVPITVRMGGLRRDGGVMIALTMLFVFLLIMGFISRLLGALLIAALILYILKAYFDDRNGGSNDTAGDDDPGGAPKSLPVSILFVFVGFALLILGARFLVTGAIDLARLLNVSETVIGLSVIAFGTSLPELATSIIAALKRQGDLVIGNVVGSNIYNIGGILGITAIIQPIDVPDGINWIDLTFLVGSAFALVIFVLTGRRISRVEGGILLASYAGFMALLVHHH